MGLPSHSDVSLSMNFVDFTVVTEKLEESILYIGWLNPFVYVLNINCRVGGVKLLLFNTLNLL
jgi:hypothetical protein